MCCDQDGVALPTTQREISLAIPQPRMAINDGYLFC